MKKKYLIRVYIFSRRVGILVNEVIDANIFVLTNSFDGINGLLAIYDGEISSKGLKYLIAIGARYLPMNHYEDFVIKCPNCGERIDDDMILTNYDENVLSGYNIHCERDNCGYQMADVEFLLD